MMRGPHADGGEERAEEEDPVRAQLGQQLLVLVEEFPRQGHPKQRTGGACGRRGGTVARPSGS